MQELPNEYDRRKVLEPGTELHLTEEAYGNPMKPNHYTVRIGALLGSGGSCLTYQGVWLKEMNGSPVERKVIIKEFYPFRQDGLPERREDGKLIITEEIRSQFEKKAAQFRKGQLNHMLYADEYSGHALPAAMFLGCAGNTYYAVSSPGEGKVLSAVQRSELSLADAFAITQSVCEGIQHIHRGKIGKRELYLDLKPDNVFTDGKRAYLFDFDTVQKPADIKYCSRSAGWSAPEQKLTPAGYENPSLIGFHTDIFAIAGILLWLLTGCCPDEETCRQIGSGFDWKSRISLRNAEKAVQSDAFCKQLDLVMRGALEPDPALRRELYDSSKAAETLSVHIENLANLAENAPKVRIAEELKETITGTGEAIQQSTRKESSRTVRTLAVIMAVLILPVFFLLLHISGSIRNMPEREARAFDRSIDAHLLLEVEDTIELRDALHQYKAGINNWKRLDYPRAMRDISEAFETVRSMRPAEDPDAAAISNSLGCLCLDMGRFEESYDYLNSANITFQKLCGADSTEALTAMFAIAQYQYSTGKTEQSLRTLDEIYDTAEEKNTALRTALLIYRAKICDELGNYDAAVKACHLVLAEYQEHPDMQEYQYDPKLAVSTRDLDENAKRSVIRTYCMLGVSGLHAERTEEAEAALNTALELATEYGGIGKENLIVAEVYQNLAVLSGQKGNLREAIQQIETAMNTEKKLMRKSEQKLLDDTPDYPGLVSVYDIFGDLLMQKGDPDAAKEKYMQALTLAQNAFGENHAETAEAWDHCGMYALQTGDLKTAQEDFQKAIEIRKSLVSYAHCKTVGYLYHSALAYREAGDSAMAAETAAEAVRIYDEAGMQSKIQADLEKLL